MDSPPRQAKSSFDEESSSPERDHASLGSPIATRCFLLPLVYVYYYTRRGFSSSFTRFVLLLAALVVGGDEEGNQLVLPSIHLVDTTTRREDDGIRGVRLVWWPTSTDSLVRPDAAHVITESTKAIEPAILASESGSLSLSLSFALVRVDPLGLSLSLSLRPTR